MTTLKNNRLAGYRIAILIFSVLALLNLACEAPMEKRAVPAGSIGWATEKMTELMVHDITNPPLAARFYAYACLSAYETIAISNQEYPSFAGFLNKFPSISKPNLETPSPEISSLFALVHTASSMQPSGAELEKFKLTLADSCKSWGYTAQEITDASRYAEEISAQVLNYAQNDQYREISNYPMYQPSEGSGKWYPTPPGYFAPVEPYFNTVRPFTLKAADQFKPFPPVAYSTDPESEFYALMNEVYSLEMNKEQREIAAFWDCNPFALEETGHLMVGIKQISPGGHWMGITAIACEQSNLSFEETIKINCLVSIGLMDGFISCWDEKYRSDRIRPETAIRKIIDPSYQPLLQTPPFPEYLSGHSTISTTAAVILTHFFGEDYQYTDTVEEQYGLGSREFTSFMQASEEASISRLYGGIHYMDAITRGQDQGEEVGNWILKSYQDHLNKTKLH
ncbi:vanadium-dependent haloperoxidase [Cyclobacterium marinum]|uniref:vanadium-dependent haloperoxidase n=1 Tax=Cyclobacterium marinum TaxID=104 RepID=UPI0011EC3A91|nr:vanadium-dependent haloperoxidase [Cyclobacterium marinum]MBI0399649.1 vanadium-dependent haloperoxidase [Cyclobacterium marinum]